MGIYRALRTVPGGCWSLCPSSLLLIFETTLPAACSRHMTGVHVEVPSHMACKGGTSSSRSPDFFPARTVAFVS